ncbi:hypothetical protein [Amycolatopsis benzoatilytica]|uniref:hypothetical protein n=1 Tax=Amycolatopsis benzoatilytica TaxID=346045 RepID=UPI000380C892|nr:hypothetical protein [Amycolatopsis benzoatilytica]
MAEGALCREPVELTGRERSMLRSVAVRGTESELFCELEAGHGHEHAAPVGRGGGPLLWLRWWPGRRVLETRSTCGAESDEGLSCRVLGGHEGSHSYELAAPEESGFLAGAAWAGARR